MQISKQGGSVYVNGVVATDRIVTYVSGTKVALNVNGFPLDFEAAEGVVLGTTPYYGNANELVGKIESYLNGFDFSQEQKW